MNKKRKYIKKPFVVHFVCEGNVFRSRLAEAYLNSRQKKYKAISSGIHASMNTNGPIGWYAAKIIKKYRLVPFMSMNWKQTDRDNLNQADLVIFFSKSYYLYSKAKYKFNKRNFAVWEIKDLADYGYTNDDMNRTAESESIKRSEIIFKKIVNKIDKYFNLC